MTKPKQPVKPSTAGAIEWEGKTLVFDLENVRVAHAVTMTAHADRSVVEIFRGVSQLDPFCMQAFLWWLLAINGHAADIGSLDFNMFSLLKQFNDALGGSEPAEVAAPKGEPIRD